MEQKQIKPPRRSENIYIRGNTYWCRFKVAGHSIRKSLKTSDRELARLRMQIIREREVSITFSGGVRAGKDDVVYFVHDLDLGMLKVGVSRKLDSRIRSMRANTASRIVLLGYVSGDRNLETVLHRFLAPFHHCREWFRADDKVLAFVRAIIELRKSSGFFATLTAGQQDAALTYRGPDYLLPDKSGGTNGGNGDCFASIVPPQETVK